MRTNREPVRMSHVYSWTSISTRRRYSHVSKPEQDITYGTLTTEYQGLLNFKQDSMMVQQPVNQSTTSRKIDFRLPPMKL